MSKMTMNPVLKKELTMSVRSPRFVMNILIYNGILMAFALLIYYANFGDMGYGYRNISYSNIIVLNMMISFVQLGLILFSVPSFTAGAIASEREKQTLDILLTTRLKPMQIIRGKLMSSISSIVILYISSLPILGITFAIGGIEWRILWELTIVILCCSIFLGSIGLYFSAKMKKSVPATVTSYAVAAFLVGGTYAIIFATAIITQILYNTGDSGIVTYILLANPLMTVICMFANQFGSLDWSATLIDFGVNNTFIIDHWFSISLVVQLVLAVFFLRGAAKNLDPLSGKGNKRAKKVGGYRSKNKKTPTI